MVGAGNGEGRVMGHWPLPPLGEYWRGQRKVLRQSPGWVLAPGLGGRGPAPGPPQPLAHHVQQYVLLLLSLGDTIGRYG